MTGGSIKNGIFPFNQSCRSTFDAVSMLERPPLFIFPYFLQYFSRKSITSVDSIPYTLFSVFSAFSYTLPKKVRRLGLQSALAAKFAQNKLVFVDDFELTSWKTKEVYKKIQSYGWGENPLFVDGEKLSTNFYLATRNIPNVITLTQGKANVHDILRQNMLVLNKNTLPYFYARIEGTLPTISKRAARLRKKKEEEAVRALKASKKSQTSEA